MTNDDGRKPEGAPERSPVRPFTHNYCDVSLPRYSRP
jgi:hypothetical protein